MEDGENDGDKEKGGKRGETEATDYCATHRCVLFTALAEAETHREHAYDHGERGHQDRTQTRATSGQRRGDGIHAILEARAGEADDEHRICRGYAETHDC